VIPYHKIVVGIDDKLTNGIEIFVVPSNQTQAIFLDVASLVAVVAFHVRFQVTFHVKFHTTFQVTFQVKSQVTFATIPLTKVFTQRILFCGVD
jgi:hypothetical protein